MSRPARAEIDLTALAANLERVREAAPGRHIAAVVKADGYGHGMVEVARTLAPDCDALAVACIEEARRLRAAGVEGAIVLLEGCFEAAELTEAERLGLTLVVHEAAQLEALEHYGAGRPFGCWLKVDTGMNRLGWPPAMVREVWQRLDAAPAVAEIVLMTHLASADRPELPQTARQLERFASATRDLPGARSLANSAAILACPAAHTDWVRPGIMLYGASPFVDRTADEFGLRPVMSLRSRIIAVRQCMAGDHIGYGATWTCPETMPVGVVAIGYGDGYPRHAPNGTPVLVEGVRVPLIGRVSMDMITIDLRPRPASRTGDEVVLWGEGLAVDEVAAASGTLGYELLCRLSSRVPRVYH